MPSITSAISNRVGSLFGNSVSQAANRAIQSISSSVNNAGQALFEGPSNSKLSAGADITRYELSTIQKNQLRGANPDRRIRLRAKPGGENYVYGPANDSNLLAPLHPSIGTNGVVFPYTPVINFTNQAVWGEYDLVHTNYQPKTFHKSEIADITISGMFTSQSIQEARYSLAVLHFFRTIIKMHYGINDSKQGAPPPTLLLSGYGEGMFSDVPVIVKSSYVDLNSDTNYVPVFWGGNRNHGWVPAEFLLSITISLQVNPDKVREEFDLDQFRNGNLLRRGGYL